MCESQMRRRNSSAGLDVTFQALAVTSILTVGVAASAFAQDAGNSSPAAQRVYTAAQAERGKALFLTSCGNCHGEDLKGAADRAPALAGDAFLKHWDGQNVAGLFSKIRTDMPRNRPGSLQDNVYLDIVALILQANGFPEGPTELTASALDTVPIAKNGVAAKFVVPNFAVVETIGCLTKGPDNRWTLRNAREPLASKDQPLTPQELQAADAQPLGADAFELISVIPFKPDQEMGHKMAAKGLLYRAPNDNRLDVTSLQRVAVACTKARLN
jgi:mono/diheme cytochrome c family protein